MMDEWYCELSGREIGPLSPEQLSAMADGGQILPSDKVRRGLRGDWVEARRVRGLLVAPPIVERNSLRSANVERPPIPAPPVPLDALVDESPVGLPTPLHVSLRHKRQQQFQAVVTGVSVVVLCVLIVAGLFLIARRSEENAEPANKRAGVQRAKPRQSTPPRSAGKREVEPVATPSDDPPEKPAEPVEDESTWTDASTQPALVANMPVRVVSVVREAAKPGEGHRLVITLEVTNPSTTTELDFDGWSPTAVERGLKLRDNHGTTYAVQPMATSDRLARPLPTLIKPGDSARDILAFELPPADAKLLRLELSGNAFKLPGTARLRIPATMITGKIPVAKPKPPPTAIPERRRPMQPGNPQFDFGIPPVDDAEKLPR